MAVDCSSASPSFSIIVNTLKVPAECDCVSFELVSWLSGVRMSLVHVSLGTCSEL